MFFFDFKFNKSPTTSPPKKPRGHENIAKDISTETRACFVVVVVDVVVI